jgi:hypothetical protein
MLRTPTQATSRVCASSLALTSYTVGTTAACPLSSLRQLEQLHGTACTPKHTAALETVDRLLISVCAEDLQMLLEASMSVNFAF